MIDIIIRDCGCGEWLPIIVETDTGRELYRGDRIEGPVLAFNKAQLVWLENDTGNIVEFKQKHGLL